MPEDAFDRGVRKGLEEIGQSALIPYMIEIPMWLCVLEAINTPELVKEFDRLKGTNLSQAGHLLELMIDGDTGRLEHDFNEFVEFVRDVIYERMKE